MEAIPIPAKSRPALLLNRGNLTKLQRANGIATERELAEIIGVRVETLWRASRGEPVSGIFAARVKLAFPHVSLDSMFNVVEEIAS